MKINANNMFDDEDVELDGVSVEAQEPATEEV
jgi:hypothetical protein